MPKPDNPNSVVELYSGQVTVKYYDPKHVYMVRINTKDQKVKTKDGIISFSEDRKEFTKVKSITQVTRGIFSKPFLEAWQVKVSLDAFANALDIGDTLTGNMLEAAYKKGSAERFVQLKKGGDIGTAVHGWVHDYIKGKAKTKALPKEKEVRVACLEFLEWCTEYEPKFLETELIVYHPGYDIAGTLDLLAMIKKLLALPDLKTSGGIYPEYYMQLAFYRATYFLMTGKFPGIAGLLHLPKDAKKDKSYNWETSKVEHEADLLAFEAALYLDRWKPNKEFPYEG